MKVEIDGRKIILTPETIEDGMKIQQLNDSGLTVCSTSITTIGDEGKFVPYLELRLC